MFAIFIAICHLFALKFYIYWTDMWFDIPMHILSGALISSIGLWAVYFSPLKSILLNSQKKVFLISILFALIVGLLWEIFELNFGLISYLFVDMVDSIKDLIDDVIGSLIAGLYFVNNIPSEFFQESEKPRRINKKT